MFSCIEEQNGGHLLYYVIILEEVSFCDFGNLGGNSVIFDHLDF